MYVSKKSRINTHIPFAIVIVTVASLFVWGGCGETDMRRENWVRAYEPDRHGTGVEDIRTHFNLHRGRWWNYYARGRWLLETGHPAAAAEDFRTCLRLRSQDTRWARTYGMHFQDYFPNRELGIILFRRGELREALEKLAASRVSEDSARCRFYLGRTREALLKKTGADAAGPAVTVTAPADGAVINSRKATVTGTVTDDQYVGAVSVGGRRLYIDLAAPRIDVDQAVRLVPGRNAVTVSATDLVGKKAAKTVTVTVDLSPPTFCVHSLARAGGGNRAVVDITGLDDIGLEQITIGKETFAGEAATEKRLRAVETELVAGGVSVTVFDRAGNRTEAVLSPDGGRVGVVPKGGFRPAPAAGVPAIVHLSLLPERNLVALAGAVAQNGDTAPPVIETAFPRELEQITTMEERIFLDGKVHDPGGISSLSLNGEPVRLARAKSEYVVFNRWVELKPGLNEVAVAARDNSGNLRSMTLRIFRDEVEEYAARMAVALMPLDEEGPVRQTTDIVHDAVTEALVATPVRFRLVERSREVFSRIMMEHQLTSLADKEQGIRVGRIIAAEGIIDGDLEEGERYINIYVELVDTASGVVLCVAEVYGEDKDPAGLRWLGKGLVSKIKNAFPVVRGHVADVGRQRAYLDVGTRHRVTRGMMFRFYREERLGSTVLHKPVKHEGTPLEARVIELDAGACSVELQSPAGSDVLRKGDMAVSK